MLAFDVHALAEGDDLVLVVEQARGAGLPRPATALAIGCLEAVLGPVAHRQGAVFTVSSSAGAIARALLPEAGARVPGADDVRWTSVAAASDTWVLHAAKDAVAAAPSEEAIRARELAMLLREADDALVANDEEAARALCMDALERAPRHAEIVRRIVDLDVRAGGRAEAALAMLVEARFPGATNADARFATLPGELLIETGDTEAAVASLERAGDTDPAPALAARAFEAAARAARDPEEAARWLDRALARSPRSASARWLRVLKRLALGRLEDALGGRRAPRGARAPRRGREAPRVAARRAGVGGGRGSRAGRAISSRGRCGSCRTSRGRWRVSARPSSATGGRRAASRCSSGRSRWRRARAAGTEKSATRRRASASPSGGRSPSTSAICRRRWPTSPRSRRDADEAPLARGLEGRWRARLGDLAGAGLAFARLRELSSSFAPGSDDPRAATVAALLGEAAQIERTRLHDPLAAQRHLAAALRLRPRDAELLRAYREVGALVARDAGGDPRAEPPDDDDPPAFPEQEEVSATHRTAVLERPALDLSLPADSEPPVDLDATLLENAEARIDELTRRLLGDPANDAVADELAGLLERAGRGHELLALLSGRMEDATPERRKELAPKAKAALLRLAEEAEAAGRNEEAALFRGALDGLAAPCVPVETGRTARRSPSQPGGEGRL